jgi:uncharacterized membrane protein
MVGGAFAAIGWESPLRVVAVLVFLLSGPGLAVADLLDVRDVAQRLAIATGFSLAVETLVGLALLYAGVFSAGLTFAIVLALSALLLALGCLRRMRARATPRKRSRAPA